MGVRVGIGGGDRQPGAAFCLSTTSNKADLECLQRRGLDNPRGARRPAGVAEGERLSAVSLSSLLCWGKVTGWHNRSSGGKKKSYSNNYSNNKYLPEIIFFVRFTKMVFGWTGATETNGKRFCCLLFNFILGYFFALRMCWKGKSN